MVKFLPGGMVMGAFFSVTFFWAAGRLRRGKERVSVFSGAAFWIYVSVMLIITFFSRESSGRQRLDLELFSTWGINDRNNAFVIENVLLFVPYGFLAGFAFGRYRRFLPCLALGAATSLGIETLQLVTGRGFFQIDDILTNTLGAVVGFLLYRLLGLFGKK